MTEVDYFKGLNKALRDGNLPFKRCVIQVLEKQDHNADPGHVIGLLDELLCLRKNDFEKVFSPELLKEFDKEVIYNYFRGIVGEQERLLEAKAAEIGLSLPALRDLCKGADDDAVYGIVIDHDHRGNLREHIECCQQRGYNVFLTTPCFDLWLLLHHVNFHEIGSHEEVFENKRISNQHTLVSSQLSSITHSSKRVDFSKYVDKLETAIARARRLEMNVFRLLDTPGTNLPLLFDIIDGQIGSMWEVTELDEAAAAEER